MRRQSGQITIFLSLILLLILALISTSLESARAAGLSYRLRLAADSSLQSVFAQYDRILWENYGLLLFAGDDSEGTELSELVLEYAGENADGGEDDLGSDWFAFTPEGAEVTALVLATDQNGRVFRQAAVRYMQECGLADAAVETILSLGVVDDTGNLTEIGESVEEQAEEELSLDQVLEEYESLEEELSAADEGDTEEETETNPGEEEDPEGDESGEEQAGSDSAEAAEAKSLVESAVETIRKLLSVGVLAFVVEDSSALSADSLGGEELPSSLSAAERARSVGTLEEESTWDSFIFCEYVMHRLDAWTTEESGGCQVEYVIAGGDSDQENLGIVVNRLLWMRETLNMAYLLTDSEKVETAEALAGLIAGWTGLVPLVAGLKYVILTVWALGESVADLRTLLSGGRVPLVKTKNSWQLSLENVAELAVDEVVSKNDSDEDSGLSYEDYLRVLLWMGDLEEQTYRCMDVIQREVCKSDSDFRMKNCVYAAQIELWASASYLFPYLPSGDGYSFVKISEYAYGEVELES